MSPTINTFRIKSTDVLVRIEYFHFANQLAGEIISTVGWPMMVTGQSVVLYSRLGIVLGPSYQNILKIVKWMIIVNGVVLHVTTSVVMFGAYDADPNHLWAKAYKYVEMVQMTIFTVQDSSSLGCTTGEPWTF